MFGLFNKEIEIMAPCTGTLLDIENVQDEVFSKKMMGDGIAIEPTDGTFVAPCDGELSMIFKTGHAFGMKVGKNVELLVHIGIDTVEMEGEGFQILAQQDTKVKAGDPIVRVDLDLVKSKGYKIVTPIIITSPQTPKELKKESGSVTAGTSKIMTVNP